MSGKGTSVAFGGWGGRRISAPSDNPRVSSQAPNALAIVVAARNEADRIAATLRALRAAFPAALLVVADDRSTDGTAALAVDEGAEVAAASRRPRSAGKGGAMTAAVQLALARAGQPRTTVLLCDGDLGSSAAHLRPLVEAVDSGSCDLAIAAFARREGGGFGVALGFARWAVTRLGGRRLRAPISGQRALRGDLLPRLLPFASGFGMEVAMDIDAARAGARIRELELDVAHRATGRNLAGFAHRARQLAAFARVFTSRALRRR
jgi:glycosyltransferase involved in cell wall biosynthesis